MLLSYLGFYTWINNNNTNTKNNNLLEDIFFLFCFLVYIIC